MDPIKTDFDSTLRMVSLACSNISVDRDPNVTPSDIKLQFNERIDHSDDYMKANVILEVKAFSADLSFSASVAIVGKFELANPVNPDFAKKIMSTNAVSIIFPYLRSQLTLATTQPDMLPIVIPPININALFENNANESKEEQD